MIMFSIPLRHGKTLIIQQEYENQKKAGKSVKLATKEDMRGDMYDNSY